jgi:peptide-methionine (S)-S-oxide reductase
MEQAMFGAGCFWGIEAAFREIEGVKNTAVGYSGGNEPNPTYQNVCAGTTGHTEVVHLEFDPEIVAYEQLLAAFWRIHDPTTLNRQGPDVGTQYRSAIYYYTPEQEKAANGAKVSHNKEAGQQRPIVTEIAAATEFYRAEEYHQCYLEKNGLGRCH